MGSLLEDGVEGAEVEVVTRDVDEEPLPRGLRLIVNAGLVGFTGVVDTSVGTEAGTEAVEPELVLVADVADVGEVVSSTVAGVDAGVGAGATSAVFCSC